MQPGPPRLGGYLPPEPRLARPPGPPPPPPPSSSAADDGKLDGVRRARLGPAPLRRGGPRHVPLRGLGQGQDPRRPERRLGLRQRRKGAFPPPPRLPPPSLLDPCVGEREGGGEQPTGSGRDSDGEWLGCARRRAASVPSSPRFLFRRHARPTCTASWGRNKTGPGRLLHPATRKRGLANDVRPYHARRSRCIAARQPPPCRCPGRCRWVTALG